MSVPYDVSRISVFAPPEELTASVKINSPTLTPGGTTKVTITVTAESGDQRVYTISVKRSQDPNYVPSDNSNLSSLSVDEFLLSPAFDQATTEYVIYLPFEVDQFKVSATAEDSKASVDIPDVNNLVAGEINMIQVDCIAEDESIKTYTIAVVRAVEFTGLISLNIAPTATPSPSPIPSPIPTVTPTMTEVETGQNDEMSDGDNSNPFKTIAIVVLAFIAVVEGVVLVIIFTRRKADKR